MSSSPYQNRLHQALARAMAEEQRNPRRSSTPLNGDAPPSPQSPSASTSASPGASQGGRRVKIKIKVSKPESLSHQPQLTPTIRLTNLHSKAVLEV